MLALSRPPEPMPARSPGPSTTPTVPLDEERAVVARLQDGDRAAFAILYGWYGDAIYRTALSRLGRRVLAEDVLRDTFRKALESIDTYEVRDRSIYWWLRRIAINLAMDHHRRLARDRDLADRLHAEPTPAGGPPHPDRGVEQEETARDVGVSLSRLNPRYAKVLRLRLLEERPREECAALLEVSLGTLDVLFHRACKAFRKVYPP